MHISVWLQNDERKYIALSTFGFYKGGLLEVKLRNFRCTPYDERDVVSRVMYSRMQIMNQRMRTTLFWRKFASHPVRYQAEFSVVNSSKFSTSDSYESNFLCNELLSHIYIRESIAILKKLITRFQWITKLSPMRIWASFWNSICIYVWMVLYASETWSLTLKGNIGRMFGNRVLGKY
jgi:hypothetical protein